LGGFARGRGGIGASGLFSFLGLPILTSPDFGPSEPGLSEDIVSVSDPSPPISSGSVIAGFGAVGFSALDSDFAASDFAASDFAASDFAASDFAASGLAFSCLGMAGFAFSALGGGFNSVFGAGFSPT
jgi:hypothetical protein